MAGDAVRGIAAGGRGDLILGGHGEIADPAATLADEVVMAAGDGVVAHRAGAEFTALDAPLLQQDGDVAIDVAQAEGGHFPFQALINFQGGRVVPAFPDQGEDLFALRAFSSRFYHFNNQNYY